MLSTLHPQYTQYAPYHGSDHLTAEVPPHKRRTAITLQQLDESGFSVAMPTLVYHDSNSLQQYCSHSKHTHTLHSAQCVVHHACRCCLVLQLFLSTLFVCSCCQHSNIAA